MCTLLTAVYTQLTDGRTKLMTVLSLTQEDSSTSRPGSEGYYYCASDQLLWLFDCLNKESNKLRSVLSDLILFKHLQSNQGKSAISLSHTSAPYSPSFISAKKINRELCENYEPYLKRHKPSFIGS